MKCMASVDGVCRNVFGFGVACDGYSTSCKLRPQYNAIERMASKAAENIRNTLGIKPDGNGGRHV